MTTLTIQIPDKVEKTLSDFVEQLGGKVIANPNLKKRPALQAEEKLTRKEKSFLKEFDEAIDFVNMHQQGKVKAKTIDQLLNEL